MKFFKKLKIYKINKKRKKLKNRERERERQTDKVIADERSDREGQTSVGEAGRFQVDGPSLYNFHRRIG